MAQREQEILIGKVIAPSGIRGEVKVYVLTDFPERFAVGNDVTLRFPEGGKKSFLIRNSREYKSGLIIKFDEIDTRNDAEALKGAEIVIEQSELAELESGRFYVFDIIGIKVVSEDGRDVGEVVDVLQGGANDVYITSTGVCIPAIKDVVAKVDIKEGLMVIRPVPGLLPEK